MLCIIRLDEQGAIVGWLIATDVDDARRRLPHDAPNEIAAKLYRMFDPPPGKHDLGDGYLMLV